MRLGVELVKGFCYLIFCSREVLGGEKAACETSGRRGRCGEWGDFNGV